MVAILTLFVGLVAGIQHVELAVSGAVAQVEIRLNGRLVGRATGQPWNARCDFGSGLHPAELVAIGLDQHGHEVSRDSVLLNVPGRRAEAMLFPEFDDEMRVSAVEVRWSSPELGEPKSLRAQVDGATVTMSENRVALERFKDARVHILTVTVVFPGGVELREELVFGAGHAGELSFDLTAIPVRWSGLKPPLLEDFKGAFVRDDTVLEVTAVERGTARLIVVRDQAVEGPIDDLLKQRKKARRRRRRTGQGTTDELNSDVVVQVMAPVTVNPTGSDTSSLLFPISGDLGADHGGLLRLISGARYPLRAFGLRRLADSVSVAGLRAATGHHRRAVVVLLGGQQEDASSHSAAVVSAYLQDLRVPLEVWDLSGAAEKDPGGWGKIHQLSSWIDLTDRVTQVRQELDHQYIVWLRGRHLPQQVELKAGFEGLELVQ